MKHKILAVLTAAGVLGITSAAFADINISVGVDRAKFRPIAQSQIQRPEPPYGFQSRDINNRPPMSGDRQPPPKPRSGDLPPHINQQRMNHPDMPKF